MKTSIIVLTPDNSISQLIGIRKTSLIPTDLRKKYQHISISSYFVKPSTTVEVLAAFFARMKNYGVIVICAIGLYTSYRILLRPYSR